MWKVISAFGLGIGDYTPVRTVGVGAQGVVFHVRDQAGVNFALKKVNLPGNLWQRDFPLHLRNADREARALKSLAWASAVVVRVHDCWIQDDFKYACIVMEWVPKPLSDVMRQKDKYPGKPADMPMPLNDTCPALPSQSYRCDADHLEEGWVAVRCVPAWCHVSRPPAGV